MKLSSILGLNARSIYSFKHNSEKGGNIASSKILTAKYLEKEGIPTPLIYAKFVSANEISGFDWEKLPDSFVIKPSRGLGGEGIVVVKGRSLRPAQGKPTWVTTQRRKVTAEELKTLVSDILEGAYSLGNAPDVALVQEYVGRHKAFRRYSYRGTPDIRVVVFNKVPIMAMLRLPTKESGGRANLHQGAIAVGIDIATGITTRAIWHGKQIFYKPDTKRKLRGIKIPLWGRVLEISSQASSAIELGYAGVDVVLHPEKGPMVLEINNQPGLQIQVANAAGLRKRIERIEDLEVRDAEQGLKIAKALFASRFADRVAAKEGVKTVSVWEMVKVVGKGGKKIVIKAKVDTGAWRTSIDRTLARDLGLLQDENVLWSKTFKSGLGIQERKVINVAYYLAGTKVKTEASIADRSRLRTPLLIGRRDLKGFLVTPRKIGD